ncbi:RNA/RNP complex-1-interacting phosphatase [Sergentomyia squamirostris]
MYNGKLTSSERFTPTDLLAALPNLGLVIDLTATDRYYKPILLAPGVSHVKLKMEGRVLPNEEIVKRFKQIITDFLQDIRNASMLVGVHCTHGVNRTGYMICRYLVDCLKVSPDDAIKRFAEARGYPIEREVYTKHLQKLPIISDDNQLRVRVERSWSDRDQRTSVPSYHSEREPFRDRRRYDGCREIQPRSRYTSYPSNYSNYQNRSDDRRYDHHHRSRYPVEPVRENWRSREDQPKPYDSQTVGRRYRWERQSQSNYTSSSNDRRSWRDEKSRSPIRGSRSWRDECRR